MLAVWNAFQHRDHKRVGIVLLIAGLILIVGGGRELTSIATSAQAAKVALDVGFSLAAIGTVSILGALAVFLDGRKRHNTLGQNWESDALNIWPPAPKPPPSS